MHFFRVAVSNMMWHDNILFKRNCFNRMIFSTKKITLLSGVTYFQHFSFDTDTLSIKWWNESWKWLNWLPSLPVPQGNHIVTVRAYCMYQSLYKRINPKKTPNVWDKTFQWLLSKTNAYVMLCAIWCHL